ncbi:MAG: hypothetical protein AAGA81_24645 [Acidobacteriota bacterium]
MKVRSLCLAGLALGFAVTGGAAAQEEGEGIERDVGFSHNGYSYSSDYRGPGRNGERVIYRGDGYCQWCEIEPFAGVGLTYRGARLSNVFDQFAFRKPSHLFEIYDDAGSPLVDVRVVVVRAGHEGAAESKTNGSGEALIRLNHAKQTHRVRIEAAGHQPLVYELTGGALRRAHHRITLNRGDERMAQHQRFVPQERSEPSKEAARAFRQGVRYRKAGDLASAKAEFERAIELWPVAGGKAGREEYAPYVELASLLREHGRTEEATSVVQDGRGIGHQRSPELSARFESALADLAGL